ncbi:DUF6778 family protein [Roseovarius salinarum]|uniref:DUF6778 family protein n=1 Tax=Roseovarius salinarum TaxID=1981892 RepID=UPI000C329CB6|nr:DUF6778 family protein [Roseovarius salinarum]
MTTKLRLVAAAALGLTLSACATVETATRNISAGPVDEAAVDAVPSPSADAPEAMAPVKVIATRVVVPRSLHVSEANTYLPGGDIVWREDPPGDRHAQVARIFEAAIDRGLAGMAETGDDAVKVILRAEVEKFHALTEKARYTTGGVHGLRFKLSLHDPATGAPLSRARSIKADLKAFGGARAIRAERAGITQKARITEHLSDVIRTELTDPEGFRGESYGLIGALNHL